MKRRELLSIGAGLALTIPAYKTLSWLVQRDHIQRAIDEIFASVAIAPALAEEPGVKPSDEASYVFPVVKAYQKMAAQAEGTYIPGSPDYNPYRVLVGSNPKSPRLIPADDKVWSKHPGFRAWEGNSRNRSLYGPVDLSVSGYPLRFSGDLSDAAGAYQFISTTWNGVRHDSGLSFKDDLGDFAPENQDLAMLYLTAGDGRKFGTGGHWWLRKAIGSQGNFLWVDHDSWLQAVRCDSREWASFKGANIGASTGQSTKPDWWMWSRFIYGLWESLGRTRNILFPAAGYGLKDRSDKMGWRAWTNPPRMHWGTDFGIPAGTPILAPEDGSVVGNETYGVSFVPDRDPTISLRFFHCVPGMVKNNTWVPRGTVITKVGPKDHMSTGPHLHFEVKAYGHLIDSWYYLGMSEWFPV